MAMGGLGQPGEGHGVYTQHPIRRTLWRLFEQPVPSTLDSGFVLPKVPFR